MMGQGNTITKIGISLNGARGIRHFVSGRAAAPSGASCYQGDIAGATHLSVIAELAIVRKQTLVIENLHTYDADSFRHWLKRRKIKAVIPSTATRRTPYPLDQKDGHPFPVPLRVYDETIRVLKSAVQNAKLGRDEELPR
jgi:hypothetical protein